MRINERIRISQIRVIAEDGSQLGVMSPVDALRLAREQGYDLVEVAPQTTPPVCRIMDFNKFRYDQARRERDAKRKHHLARLKETKFKPRIGEHDYQVKLQQVKRFLMRGDKVKVTVVFRGREMTHLELGRRILDRLPVDLRAIGRIERTPMLEGRFMTMIVSPDHDALKRASRTQQGQSRRALEGAPASPPTPTTTSER